MLDEEIFSDGFEAIAVRYGKESLLKNEIVIETYYSVLKTISSAQFMQAVKQVIKVEEFFPTAKKILEYAGAYRPEGENWESFRPAYDENAPKYFLASHVPTPEEIEEGCKRGRLTARIILSSTGIMTIEQKDKLIDDLSKKPTHELEAIAEAAQAAQNTRKVSKRSSWGNLAEVAQNLSQQIQEKAKKVYEEEIPF